MRQLINESYASLTFLCLCTFVWLIAHNIAFCNIARDILHVSIHAENARGIRDGKSQKGICNGSRRHAGYKCRVREP